MRLTAPPLVRLLGVALVAGIASYALHAVTRVGGPTAAALTAYLYPAMKAAGLAVLVARVVLLPQHRLAFALLSVGYALNLAGDVAWEFLYEDATDVIPVPSLADVFYLVSYPPIGVGIALLIGRSRTRAVESGLWLDGVVVALTLTTAMAYVVLPPLVASLDGTSLAGVLTNAAYPLGDAVVLATLVGSLALRNWQVDLRAGLLALGFVVFVATDALYLVQIAEGTYTAPSLLDIGWLVAVALIGAAAWVPVREDADDRTTTRLSALAPSVAGAVAIALLLVDQVGEDTEWLLAPVAVTALLIFLRFSLVSHDNHRLIDHNRAEAMTDALTGLANRRRLLADLAVADDRDRALVLFDLDGFKLYNDTFGHPAGDVLLQMIGADLRDALGERGTAYRLGGDEFCAVVPTDADPDAVGAELAAAMSREGHGFSVGASFGTTVVPAGDPAPARALGEADERLYACKHRRRVPADDQSADVLLAVLAERTPDLGHHVDVVAGLAAAVAERLGMTAGEVEQVRRAGALHDIGKMAVPDAILEKPGPLSDDEWRLMRQHTVIGERILAAAPALRGVADIVRASHERWDGDGYPDGVAGGEIPLGARIVFACDAYDAMTADRPYTRARSSAEAVAELRRCAGTQFDPRVVAALAAELAARNERLRDVRSTPSVT